ncbi:hypothetical protein OHA72_59015 [Dactylosporangium sp. NBC_01737]|uniref:hypothetical protein n=1 Tax=Dactylosporangium sp. NBC_01737 TaxID=2975959 RepID=UPI002E147CBA|nr:hypothetical protein OHA72_59015 [Dactylosporangium sp. NBC_01737]
MRVAGADTVRRDPDGARALVAACAGLPLAVLIVAGRLRARPQWTPSALAERLAGEHRRLDELRQGDLAIRSTFQAAYAELSEVDRLVFRRAGSHPGQVFTLAAAAARAGVDVPQAEAAMDRLVDAFLVESPGPDRFHLHDLLRLFATETLTAQEHADASQRLLTWLLPRPAGTRDIAGLPAVLAEGVGTGRHQAVTALVDAVHGDVTDPFDRLAMWTAAAEAAGGDRLARARALRWVSHSLTIAGRSSGRCPRRTRRSPSPRPPATSGRPRRPCAAAARRCGTCTASPSPKRRCCGPWTCSSRWAASTRRLRYARRWAPCTTTSGATN